MGLGGPVFGKPEGPDAWCQAVRRLGYRAVFCPVPIGTDGETGRGPMNGPERAREMGGEQKLTIETGFKKRPTYADKDEFKGAAEADATHRAGMVMAYTAHTGVMPILDYLSRLPVDSILGIDIAIKDTDPCVIRDRLAATKAFWVGPSSTYHIWNGPEATRQAGRQVFECFGRRGLILSQCVSSHSIMPWESTVAMIEEWKRLR